MVAFEFSFERQACEKKSLAIVGFATYACLASRTGIALLAQRPPQLLGYIPGIIHAVWIILKR